MLQKIIIAAVIVLLFVGGALLLKTEEPQEARKIAEDWILNNSPTYLFDGFGLRFVSEEELAEGKSYSFVFSFESRAAGYGDRTDELVAQVITPHTIEIVVENGRVISAITDGVYDEIKGEMTEGVLPETMNIKLYFVQVIDGQEEIVEVERSVPYTIATGRAAIEELLRGPLPHEEAEGLSSMIKEGTDLQSINIQNGVAFVDFNEKLQEGVAGSAWVMAIRGQIEKTLLQFDTVEEVVISIDGRTEDILQP